MVSFNCVVGNYGFKTHLFVSTLGPMFLGLMSWASLGPILGVVGPVFVAFFFLPSSSLTIFRTFVCTEFVTDWHRCNYNEWDDGEKCDGGVSLLEA